MSSASCDVCHLPLELLTEFFSWLPLDDIKNVRLTCSDFYNACCSVEITKNEILVIPRHHSVEEITDTLSSCRYKRLNVGFRHWRFESSTSKIWEKCGSKIYSLLTKHCTFGCVPMQSLIFHCTELREWKLQISDDKYHIPSVCNMIRALNKSIENGMTRKKLIIFDMEVCSGVKCNWNFLMDKILITFPDIKSFTVRKRGWDDLSTFKGLSRKISRHLTQTQFEKYINVSAIEEVVFHPTTNGSWFRNMIELPLLRLKKIQATFLHPMEIIESFFAFFSNQKQIEIVHLIFKNIKEEKLKKIIFHILKACPNLRELRVSYPGSYNLKFDTTDLRFILNLPKLKIFDVYFRLTYTNNMIPDLENRCIDQNTLRSLIITNAECTENDRIAILRFFPYLHELELSHLTDGVLQAIFQYQMTLHILKLDGIEECSIYGFTGRKLIEYGLIKKELYQYSIKRLQELIELTIYTGNWTVSGNVFYEFEFPRLKHINISYSLISNPISYGPLLYMIRRAPSLTRVSLTICDSVLRYLLDEIFIMSGTILTDLTSLQLTVYNRATFDQPVNHLDNTIIYVITKHEEVWDIWSSAGLSLFLPYYTLPICSVMLQNSEEKVFDKNEIQKSPMSFLTKFFKWKKFCLKSRQRNCASVYNEKITHTEPSKRLSCSMACIPSSISVRDVLLSPYPPSPALSIPSRNKNIDHDMEALRLSRQDDPFLKVLASRESLADSYIAESDHDVGGTGMPPVLLPDVDPLTIPEFHKHMVRSPPPVNWPRSPVFRFENSSQESLGARGSYKSHHYSRESVMESISSGFVSPNLSIPKRSQRSSSAEAKERRSNSTFSLIPPSSFRSLSEVRRMHVKSSEENQYLVTPSQT